MSLKGNPINDRQYQEILGLNPTLSSEIKRSVENVLFEDIVPILLEELNDNQNIVSLEHIEEAKKQILFLLEELEELTGDTKRIQVVIDSCFTNAMLLVLLERILGPEAFQKYVNVVNINYETPSTNDYLEENLENNHSLILLWGSLSDVYSMHSSHYDWYLANLIKQVWDEYYQKFLNKRILGICFGQQFMANIIGLINKNTSGIIATVKWPSQFAPSNCKLENLSFVNPVFTQALSGVSNFWTNWEFTSVFTRTGYVKFDLLNTGGPLAVIPLVKDQVTGWVVGWWSKNGHIMGVQFHPEIQLLSWKKFLKTSLEHVMRWNPNAQDYLGNFEVEGIVKKDIWDAFYVFAILAFLQDIKSTYLNLWSIYDEVDIPEVDYHETVQRLMHTTANRVDYLVHPQGLNIQQWIESIDTKWRLLMNHILDWKVNRGIEEISEILWMKSIVWLIDKHMLVQWSKNYIVRDLWAGDGNMIGELQEKLKDKSAIIYGTWDYIYFDLYSCITKKTNFPSQIPDELIILFVEKVIFEFKKIDSHSTIERLKKAIQNLEFSPNDTIIKSSMTSKTTCMFENENVTGLPEEIQSNFDHYLPILHEMQQYVTEHFYSLFSDSFQKIYISKFSDLFIHDEVISKIDFQFSIRATSHVSGREYMKVISDYFYNSAKPGSIFLDNWVHQSYTSIPRLKELYEVWLDLVDSKMRLIYDAKTNYFSSVIITKQNHYDDEFFADFLSPTSKIVPLREAYKSTFFRLEYFIRNFIISNFKNHIVFWDYNSHIIDTLKTIMEKLVAKETDSIAFDILNLINHIASTYTNNGVSYNAIDISLLQNYQIDGESLSDIIKSEVYIPEWMNIHANRKY